MPGSPMLYLKGMRILMFQLSGLKFQPSKEVSETRVCSQWASVPGFSEKH